MSEARFEIYYNSPKTKYKSYEDPAFVTGSSPVVLDVKGDLGTETYNGEIINDGCGDIGIEISSDGSTYGDVITVKQNETFPLKTFKVNKLRLSWIADTAYRARVW
jgi:hypothetical protein